jgi:hypothetical protein
MTDPLAAIEARHAIATEAFPSMRRHIARFTLAHEDVPSLLARVRTAEGRVRDLESRLAGEQPLDVEAVHV